MRALVIATTLFMASGVLMGVALDPGMPWSAMVLPRLATISFDDVRTPDFYSRVERLFNSHFPYRDELRRSKAWVDYHVFQSSPVHEVHVGPDRWLNYYHELHDYQKAACDQAQTMRELARQLHELEEVVETSGRTFVFTVAPNKSTIYPEYVGLSRSPTCGKGAYALLLEAFGDYPVKQFVRLDELLLEAKQQGQIYYRTDTHWNEEGVLVVARALLQRLAPDAWHDYLGEVTMTTMSYSGDLARMMGLAVSETAPHIQTKPWQTTSTEDRLPDALDIRHTRISPSASSDRAILPRAVFYRDSFMEAPLEILGGAFGQIDAYWVEGGPIHLPTSGSEQALSASRIVLVEVVERNLTSLQINVDAFREAFGTPSGDDL